LDTHILVTDAANAKVRLGGDMILDGGDSAKIIAREIHFAKIAKKKDEPQRHPKSITSSHCLKLPA
jgi:hypothetical protein